MSQSVDEVCSAARRRWLDQHSDVVKDSRNVCVFGAPGRGIEIAIHLRDGSMRTVAMWPWPVD